MSDRKPLPERDEYLLSRYLDGTLTRDEERAIEKRLETDARWAQCLDEFRQVDRWVGTCGEEVPGIDWSRFEAEFQRRRALPERPKRRSLVFKLFVPMAAAAALFVAFTAIQTAPPPSPTMFVAISRAPRVAVGASESYVSYGPPRGTAKRSSRPSSGDVVIAFASVGGRVD